MSEPRMINLTRHTVGPNRGRPALIVPAPPDWGQILTLVDAAKALYLSEGTLRRWVRKNPSLRVQVPGAPRRVIVDLERVRHHKAHRDDWRERHRLRCLERRREDLVAELAALERALEAQRAAVEKLEAKP